MKNEKEIAKSNYEMLKSYAKEFIHHGMELQKALKKEKEIDAWVVAKAERATTDLSDITHYLDGKTEYAKGGNVEGREQRWFLIFVDEDGNAINSFVIAENEEEAEKEARFQGRDESGKVLGDNWELDSIYSQGYYAKGGKLDKKATYVPKRDIAEVEVEKNGKTKYVDGADLLDGLYVKKSKFAKGGEVSGKFTKAKLLELLDDYDDAEIKVKGKYYIIYNPDSNNDDNKAMWGSDKIKALNEDGDEFEFNYSQIESFKYAKGGITTNSKQVRDAVKKHILESVYDENEKQFKNFDEASKYLAEEFKRVADYKNNQSKFPNNQDRFTDYLKGIPFHFEYTDEGLEKFLNGLGINPTKKEYTGDQMWKLYGALIWKEVYPKYNKYVEGGSVNRSDSGQLNGMYLDRLPEERKKEILTTIAKHYDISLKEANEEVRDTDAELLFEYTSSNEELSVRIYNEIKDMIYTYAKGGVTSTYKKANWRFW